jgi:hypothetical protein
MSRILGMLFVLVLLVGAAIATINIPSFVGKGDVQTLFGWNNHTMQANHEAVTFEYVAEVGYEFDCEWWTGPSHNRTHHQNTQAVSMSVTSDVVSDNRKTGQYTGWYLTPINLDEPVVSQPDCSGYGAGKTFVEGTLEVGDIVGGLYAVFEGEAKLLP